jgi:tRNA pseudouridine55 synthase
VAALLDKPAGWSSFRIVKVLRRQLGIKKIGHAGTLDPMATGLVICCIGRSATRRISYFMNLPKEYTGVLRLGESTASYDAESEVLERKPITGVTDAKVKEAFSKLTGEIEQIPPMYSAVQIGGTRLYKLARKGVEIERAPRSVRVERFEMMRRDSADVAFRVVCSKGTYVRSLAHDVGRDLGVGAHLVELRRTRIGDYRVEDAIPADKLQVG